MSDGDCQKDVSEPPCAKKIKIDEQNENGVKEYPLELKDFVPEKILNNNTNRKTVCVQGKFKDKSGVGIVILEKNAFRKEELNDTGYFSVDSELRTFFTNDIYGNFECFPKPSLNGESSFTFEIQGSICCILTLNVICQTISGIGMLWECTSCCASFTYNLKNPTCKVI